MRIGVSEQSSIREADLILARWAAAGDRAALHAVVERHVQDLFHVARGFFPKTADAEDAVQDALIASFRSIGTYDGRASLLTWMTSILVRRTRKLWRKRQRRSALPLDEQVDSPNIDAKLTVAGVSQDWQWDLTTVLARLTVEQREVIVLRELHSLSYEEIAATLNIPQGTVESRIHRATRNYGSICRRIAHKVDKERRQWNANIFTASMPFMMGCSRLPMSRKCNGTSSPAQPVRQN